MSQASGAKSDTNNNSTENASSSEASEGNICRDYQRGVCNRGNKCKFNHPAGKGTDAPNAPMICRDFQNGKCSRVTCKYLHITNQEEKVFLRNGSLPPHIYERTEGRYGGSRGEMTRAGPGDPVCKDFLNGKCTRGNNCKFRHAQEDERGGRGGPPGPYYGSGYDYPRKRRRDSYGDSHEYYTMLDENDALRRKISDLQKQIEGLKATNEVLLEQNARYRNQAGNSRDPYSSNYGGTNSSNKEGYSTAYPPRNSYRENYSSYPTSGSSGPYNASKDNYGASKEPSPPGSNGYTSNTAYGSGYTKFE